MNGAPIPADPTGPPEGFLFVLFLIGIVFVVFWFRATRSLDKHAERRRNAAETLERAIAEEKEEFEHLRIQTLINQSPGGRKPWQ